MHKINVRMVWGGNQNKQWMMNILSSGFFLMNFPNCKNVNRYFEGLDPDKTNDFEITIRPIKRRQPLKQLAYAACLLLILTSQANAEEIRMLTVDKCVESALQSNLTLRVSQLNMIQAGAKRTQAVGQMLPVLSTSFYGALSTEGSVLAFDVRATQPLFLGGELMASKQKADAGVEFSQHAQTLSKAEIAYLARRLFFEIKKKEAEVKLAEEELIHAKKLKDAAATFVETENEPETVLLVRITEVSQKEKELLERQQELKAFYEQLFYITALDPETSYVLADLNAEEFDPEKEIGVSENASLERMLDLQINQAQQELKIARSNRFPKAYLVSRYRHEDESFYEKNALEAGVLVKWNIWDFGITSSEIQAQKAELTKRELGKHEEIQKHQAELRQVQSALETKAKVIGIARRDVMATEEQFKNAKAKQINGDISALAMDEIRIRYLTAQTNLSRALCDYEITKALLLKVLGSTGVEE